MKTSISTLILILMGLSTAMAQSNIMIDSYYFTRTNGLEVFLNNSNIGQTPVNFQLPVNRTNTLEFRNQRGQSVMKLNIRAEEVNNIRNVSSAPSWYGSGARHTGYPGYRLATAEASSRSLSISLNKAKTDAFDQLARARSGNRSASAGRIQSSQSVPGAQILECHIYFDGNGFRTYLLVGTLN